MLILQLKLFSNNAEKITTLKIKQLPTTTLNVRGVLYKLHAAIFHHGPSIIGGHYTAMVREDKKWIQLDDERSATGTWPRNSKDAYVLFYVKVVSRLLLFL